MTPPPPRPPLFPYTTLFRSRHRGGGPVGLPGGRGRRASRSSAAGDHGHRSRGSSHRPAPGHLAAACRTEIGRARLNSSHVAISYAVFCLKKKKNKNTRNTTL